MAPADKAGHFMIVDDNGTPYRESRTVITWVDPLGAEVLARQLQAPRRPRPTTDDGEPASLRTRIQRISRSRRGR